MTPQNQFDIRISDAADGLLSESELQQLEKELQAYPELEQAYHEIMALQSLKSAWPVESCESEIQRLTWALDKESTKIHYLQSTWTVFVRAGVAALLLVIAGSWAYTSVQTNTQDRDVWTDWAPPIEQNQNEEYLATLEGLF